MFGMMLTQMINIEDVPNIGTVLILNNLLSDDFRQFMRRYGWEYIPMPDFPMFWDGFIITNPTAIAEIKRRAVMNPWFAFSEVDKL